MGGTRQSKRRGVGRRSDSECRTGRGRRDRRSVRRDARDVGRGSVALVARSSGCAGEISRVARRAGQAGGARSDVGTSAVDRMGRAERSGDRRSVVSRNRSGPRDRGHPLRRRQPERQAAGERAAKRRPGTGLLQPSAHRPPARPRRKIHEQVHRYGNRAAVPVRLRFVLCEVRLQRSARCRPNSVRDCAQRRPARGRGNRSTVRQQTGVERVAPGEGAQRISEDRAAAGPVAARDVHRRAAGSRVLVFARLGDGSRRVQSVDRA